eukprot:CAMPEP_0178986496 /NCGR_PEP_ID=MMETSP0795-20121207/2732_1 /TAXON_ID=88552 /ORGANISM="Amoebophrya sp., Strain Ameob2" /LENGTH=365 /DNA_ID=CAMNT_0020677555 /DNA_START=124 /DNA_END=1217 /DNA_ORIENTATION=-
MKRVLPKRALPSKKGPAQAHSAADSNDDAASASDVGSVASSMWSRAATGAQRRLLPPRKAVGLMPPAAQPPAAPDEQPPQPQVLQPPSRPSAKDDDLASVRSFGAASSVSGRAMPKRRPILGRPGVSVGQLPTATTGGGKSSCIGGATKDNDTKAKAMAEAALPTQGAESSEAGVLIHPAPVLAEVGDGAASESGRESVVSSASVFRRRLVTRKPAVASSEKENAGEPLSEKENRFTPAARPRASVGTASLRSNLSARPLGPLGRALLQQEREKKGFGSAGVAPTTEGPEPAVGEKTTCASTAEGGHARNDASAGTDEMKQKAAAPAAAAPTLLQRRLNLAAKKSVGAPPSGLRMPVARSVAGSV